MSMTKQSGSWSIQEHGELTYFHFRCPCGCGSPGALQLVPQATWKSGQTPAVWGWNGDKEAPRLHPSIKRGTPCGWHGLFGAAEWDVPAGCWRPGPDSVPLAPDIIRSG